MIEHEKRERTFTWADPREVAREVIARPHAQWMQAMIDGTIPPPPFAKALDMCFESAEPGRVVFSALAHEWASNPVGVIHGGYTSSLLDSVLTLAVQTRLPDDRAATTVDLHVHLVRPMLPDGARITAEGIAVYVGSTLATAEGRVVDASGKIVAHGTGTFAIISPQGSRTRASDSNTS